MTRAIGAADGSYGSEHAMASLRWQAYVFISPPPHGASMVTTESWNAPACRPEPVMKPEHDTEYALEREAQERIAARTAIDPAARNIHLKLAKSYADQASSPSQPFMLSKRRNRFGDRIES